MIVNDNSLNRLNYLNFDQPENCPVKAGQYYTHYKEGSMYTVICVALDSETKEEFVVYQGWLSGKVWIRSVADFTASVGDETSQVKRFTLQETKEPLVIISWEQFKETFGVKDNDCGV